MLPTTTSRTIPTRAQMACGSWPYLQHVALHKSGPFTRQTTSDINKTNNNKGINNNNNNNINCNSDINKSNNINNNKTNNINNNPNANTINLITIRNMSIYNYLRQHFNAAGKRNRRYSTDSDEDVPPPSPKVRKHNHYHHNNNNNHQQKNESDQERDRERRKQHGKQSPNSNLHNYDIRFFFYINSLILFTMSCRQYEGEDLKHFIVKHIREFDRLRRKARKRRKRKTKPTTTSLPL